MPSDQYEVTIETPDYGEVIFTVETAVFDSNSVRFTGLDPSQVPRELRDEFTFMSKELTAILDTPSTMEHISLGIIPNDE